jgi:hypothetical protein
LTGNGKSDVGSFADCTLKKGHPIWVSIVLAVY